MNIATTANNLPKINKQKAIKVLSELFDSENLTKEQKWQVASLYKILSPATPAKVKTPEQWINKAVPKKDYRYYLLNSYSDGDNLVGTDGHRLHVVATELATGYYDKNVMPVDEDARFPDYKRVIGTYSEYDFKPIDTSKLNIERLDKMEIYEIDDLYYNRKYVDEALADDDKAEYQIIDLRLYIKNKFGLAIVMPTRK